MITPHVSATEDLPTSCNNKSFDNISYLLHKNDIKAAGIFFLLKDLESSPEKTNFRSFIGRRNKITTFYDFAELQLHNAGRELVHTIDNNLLNYRRDREKISYVNRSLLATETKWFEVKHYNKKLSPLDKHPFFGQIKRQERTMLIDYLANISEAPSESITESLIIESTENVRLITLFGIPHATITLSDFSIINIGVPNTFLLFKMEIFHEQQENLKQYEKEYLNAFFCRVHEKFQRQFTETKSYPWFGYAEYHKLAIKTQPSHLLFRRYPEIFSLGQILSLTCIGFLFIYFILGRYTRQSSYRKITKIKYQK